MIFFSVFNSVNQNVTFISLWNTVKFKKSVTNIKFNNNLFMLVLLVSKREFSIFLRREYAVEETSVSSTNGAGETGCPHAEE